MKKHAPDSNVDIPRLEQCNLAAIRLGSRLMSKIYDAALAPAGIKSSELSIMSLLAHRAATAPTVTVTELAAALAPSRSTARQHLQQLELAQLVCATGPSGAARGLHFGLTAAGRLKLHEAIPLWRSAQNYFEKIYGAEPAQQLRLTLRHIAQDQQQRGHANGPL